MAQVNSVQPQVVYVQQKKNNTGKAVGSFFIPGLGQLIDGRKKDGLTHLGIARGLGIAGGLISLQSMKNVFKSVENSVNEEQIMKTIGKTSTNLGIAGLGLGLANIALHIYSCIDAANGGKKAKNKSPELDKNV